MSKAIILIAIGTYLVYRSRENSQLNYNIMGIKWAARPVVVLNIYNPTIFPIPFNSVVADVYFNGQRLGIINQLTPQTLPAGSKSAIDLFVDADPIGFANAVADLVKLKAGYFTHIVLKLQGVINAAGISLPLNLVYNIK